MVQNRLHEGGRVAIRNALIVGQSHWQIYGKCHAAEAAFRVFFDNEMQTMITNRLLLRMLEKSDALAVANL